MKIINKYRKRIMFFLTNQVGKKTTILSKSEIKRENIKRVLICRPNHRLGNQLLITPLVQEVSSTFPNCKIDLFLKGGLGPIIFKNYDNVETIIQLPKKHFKQLFLYIKSWSRIRKIKYDIAINVEKNSSSGRLSTKFANATYHFFGDNEDDFRQKHDDYFHMAKYPVYSFREYITTIGLKAENNEVPTLNLKLSADELIDGKKKLSTLTQNNQQTICLFTYATGAKCHSTAWWSEFYENLKIKFPNKNIIEILPVENISMIDFKAPTFYSKDIREMASLMANTNVFVGADSGIMHLASAAQVPVLGLFSVTNMEKYKPYNSNSIGLNTNDSNNEAIYEAIESILN
ncbi:glycosyltransferase family 9 protein [Flavobacterium sp.]|uniref:glycosyltransferase family 9 protein n=1 Tax=Flavobacterium sp. TaxID=239 RepID=UPI0025BAA9EA|nr:glycosyltransferase family 9 protein [Flavobacterium sp.]MBA4155073.1 ADP-heptose--LPS heptosyltransferase [Flavobacterium sp.]